MSFGKYMENTKMRYSIYEIEYEGLDGNKYIKRLLLSSDGYHPVGIDFTQSEELNEKNIINKKKIGEIVLEYN